jgi:hypothetical protein
MYSSPVLVLECLKDNFATLLDRQLHTSHGNMSGHSQYDSEVRSFHGWKHSQQIFYHKNTKDQDTDYSYMQRCVCRFRGLLQSDERKLFLLMLLNQNNPLDKILMRSLLKKLADDTANTSELLVVFHQTGEHFHMQTESEDNLTFLLVVSRSRSDGSRLGNLDEEQTLRNKISNLYDYNIDTDVQGKEHKCICQPTCNILKSKAC